MKSSEATIREFVRLARLAAREDAEFLRALATAIWESTTDDPPSAVQQAQTPEPDESLVASLASAFSTRPDKSEPASHPDPIRQAKGLADRLDAPHSIVLKLASQPIEIAEPMLRMSCVLTQDDLIDIVKQLSGSHALVIAGRWDVGGNLADAILAYGNSDVWLALLSNANADISSQALSRLGKQAGASTRLRDALLKRDTLPIGLITELLDTTWGDVRDELLAKLIQVDAGEKAYRLEIPEKMRRSRKFIDASQLADKLVRRRGVDERVLVELAHSRKQLELLMCCSRLFSLDIDTTLTMLTENSGISLATFCRAKNLNVDTFSQIVTTPHTGPSTDIQKDPVDILSLLQFYKRLPVQDAIRAIKIWRKKSGNQLPGDQAIEENAEEVEQEPNQLTA